MKFSGRTNFGLARRVGWFVASDRHRRRKDFYALFMDLVPTFPNTF